MTVTGEIQYYILKQFAINADIWVAKLTPDDPEYVYSTLEEAETQKEILKDSYPNNRLKISAA